MRVAVLGFGSIWRRRLRECDPGGRLNRAVYYNTTGVLVKGNVRQRPQICGYARFDAIGGFDANHPSRMIGRVFECAEPCVWLGYNKLFFKRVLAWHECADYFLVVAKSGRIGELPVGSKDWRSPGIWLLSLSECAGQQEALLLMSVGDWLRTRLGLFVLEASAAGGSLPQFVLRAGE